MADISKIKLPDGNTYDVKDTSKSSATNWVNGSATGSVRTTGSTVEDSNYTIGIYAVAEGIGTKASGQYSHAEGGGTIASGSTSHAEGGGTTASGNYSHAEGGGATASGNYSHTEGNMATASGDFSHTEGNYTIASGNFSHVEGWSTIANHAYQHVFGQCNIEDPSTASADSRGNYIEIVGIGANSSNRSNARTLDWSVNEVLAGKLTVGVAGTNSLDVATIGQLPTKTSDLTNDSGFITGYTETDPVFTASAAHGISTTDITNWNSKQATLVSGTNIKTVNGNSLLGSGNLTITSGSQVQIVRWTENLTTT